MTDGFSFPKSKRLRHAADFARVYARHLHAGDGNLLVFADANPEGGTRVGLSVSKKHGNAVRRQRLKRLLREAYRLEQHSIPQGLDLILIPRVGLQAGVMDFRRSLVQLVRRVHRRVREQPAMPPPASEPARQ